MTRKAKMQPIVILQRLQAAKSKKALEKVIIDAWNSDSEEFFLGLEMSVDPNLKFGITSAPEIQDPDDGDPGSFTFNDFLALTQSLSSAQLDEAEARRAVVEAALRCNVSEWNKWYRRILLKNLHHQLPMDVITKVLFRLTNR
jgi:hypothetical protein